MLPFTKRPGRGEESSDVVAKDDIAAKSSPSVVPPASSSRPTTMRPPASAPSARGQEFDEEMTGLVPGPRSALQASTLPAPVPAAGRPASMPPPRSIRPSVRPAAGGPASMRPPPASARDAYEGEDEDAEDEDGGRTIVRPEGAGKSVRRSSPQSSPPPRSTPSANPTSISPAAVIRQTMESQRAATRGLASGPPPELRGDLDHHQENDDYTQTAAPRTGNRTGAHRSNYPPPASYEGPPSHRPPQRATERLDFANDDFRRDATAAPGRNRFDSGDDYSSSSSRNQAPPSPQSGPVSSPRSGPVSQPPASSARPGHFANPAPSSYAPPPNGVNPHGPTHAMPAVGYGAMPNASVPPAAASHAAMPAHFRMAQTGAVAGVMADPPGTSVTSNNRVSGRPAMSWAAALAACGVFVGVVAVAIAQRGDSMTDTQAALVDPAHTGKTTATQPVETTPPANPLPPGLIGASPVQAQAPAAATAPAVAPVAAPVNGMSDPSLGIAPPAQAAAQPAAAATGEKVAKAPKASSAPARTSAPARPARPAADEDEEKPAKKPAKAGKGGDADEETRRALEELRKAQLEQSLGK